MTPPEEMKPLSQRKRRFIFLLSLLLFIITVPFSVFYAIGYRFDFSDDIRNIKSVGGMYVRNDTNNTDMYVNNQPVRDMRVFQRAAYIQNLEAGIHRIHVQGEHVQTWVKQLPVYAHFVTEVSSFNMPRVPQVRLITEWTDPSTGASVVLDQAATSTFAFASVTAPVIVAPATIATSTLTANAEFDYVQSLVASSTEQRVLLQNAQSESGRFLFGSEIASSSVFSLVGTTTTTWRNFTLREHKGEVYMHYSGASNDTPYYYCVLYSGKVRTSLEYGEHVYESLRTQFPDLSLLLGSRICRDTIRIDRLNQEVLWFGFFPNSSDIVLMHLQDGLYAVEVDDRSWQNTQLLYPGSDFHVAQDGGRIYIQDGEHLLEIYTEIASQ